MAETREFHLWTHVGGAWRWAMTVVEDDKAEDAFRVVDLDPQSVDADLMAGFAETMREPVRVMEHTSQGGLIGDAVRWAPPGDPAHFAAAIRMVPRTHLRPGGRP